ncbi:hypothetical protein R3I93_008763 [Phoxinus phoxinus]|uniref:TNFR-Cys domain-containing protein n=1 Tax=Phoxinus phoxinus TaxID=58324 RepID=A0AAN9D5R1_9TELE
MLALLIVLLLSSHVLPLVQSLTCDESTEYEEHDQCCKKCEPGQIMEARCGTSSPDTPCRTCGKDYYMDVYNENFACHQCTTCTKEHMKYEKECSPKRDAVCTCDEGYICSDGKCEMCEKKPETYTPSPRPADIGTAPHTQNMHDHVDGSCQHQPISGPPKRATLDPVSAQRKRRYQCQCRRCVERQRNWRMSEKGGARRPLMRLRIEYLL